MRLTDVMNELETYGNEQTKRIFLNHGAREPFFGVKVADLKKILKKIKKQQQLALDLYQTGNSDAMYLAGLAVNPKEMSESLIRDWADKAYWYMLSEYTVAWVAAESAYGHSLALEWMESDSEHLAACGWSTYSNLLALKADEELDLNEIRSLLKKIEKTIHSEKNRVRYTMNGFVLSVAAYVLPLLDDAKHVGEMIGHVQVEMGKTACKVPFAPDYIKNLEVRGRIGKKKKTVRC